MPLHLQKLLSRFKLAAHRTTSADTLRQHCYPAIYSLARFETCRARIVGNVLDLILLARSRVEVQNIARLKMLS